MIISAKDVKKRIEEACSHFTFEYNNKKCGIDPIFHPDKKETTFEMWYGEDFYVAKDIKEVMSKPFFNEKSLSEIIDKIDVIDF